MPVKHNIYTLSRTVPTKIVGEDNQPQEVHLHNMTKSSNQYVYIGSDNVSITNSVHLDPGESLTLNLLPLDGLWAVSDPDGLDIAVLIMRKAD